MKNVLFTLFIAMIAFIDVANAQTNPKISIQGILREASGIAVEDGEYDLMFRIYTDINDPISENIFEEEHPGVTVANGIYSIYLGEHTSMGGLNFDEVYYVGVQVGATELQPRIELTHSPYSMAARSVSCSGAVGDVKYSILDWDDFQEVNGDCWIQMNGQSVDNTTAIAQMFGITEVPDMSGLFMRAHEWNDGNDPDRTPNSEIATLQSDEILAHAHSGTTDETTSTMPEGGDHDHEFTDWFDQDANEVYATEDISIRGNADDKEAFGDDDGSRRRVRTSTTSEDGSHSHIMDPHSHTFTTNTFGGNETRPKNMNFYIYIRVN